MFDFLVRIGEALGREEEVGEVGIFWFIYFFSLFDILSMLILEFEGVILELELEFKITVEGAELRIGTELRVFPFVFVFLYTFPLLLAFF